jgi:hypothetical protein
MLAEVDISFTKMKNPFIRYGWPRTTMLVMAVIFIFGQIFLAFIANLSGWSSLRGFYRTEDKKTDSLKRIDGELKLGGIRFTRESAKVYQVEGSFLIEGPNIDLALGFLHFPDLLIPVACFESINGGRGSFIICGPQDKVYFEMKR